MLSLSIHLGVYRHYTSSLCTSCLCTSPANSPCTPLAHPPCTSTPAHPPLHIPPPLPTPSPHTQVTTLTALAPLQLRNQRYTLTMTLLSALSIPLAQLWLDTPAFNASHALLDVKIFEASSLLFDGIPDYSNFVDVPSYLPLDTGVCVCGGGVGIGMQGRACACVVTCMCGGVYGACMCGNCHAVCGMLPTPYHAQHISK